MRRANPIYDVVFKYLMESPGVRCNLKNHPIQPHEKHHNITAEKRTVREI